VRVTHLSLANFRSYARLELDLPPGVVLLVGENAQGKTNLLEALYILATTRSPRASSETELIRRAVQHDPLVAARIVGVAERAAGRVQVEVAVARREGPAGEGGRALHAAKRLRVNGVPHRAADVIGRILAVLFTSTDIDLITGPPAGRRRYLDITVSQVDHAYLRGLQRYNHVLQQRNSLLRQINEGRARPDQLAPWDEELVAQGSTVISTRMAAVAELSTNAGALHARLSGGREQLSLTYLPKLGGGPEQPPDGADLPTLQEHFRDGLQRRRPREVAAGLSLIGPHRDDIRFDLDGDLVATFGSRAQQRTVALAIRLAEAAYLQARAQEAPILLLDDILSELDERRRAAVLDTIAEAEQALITTADLDRFTAGFLQGATVYRVADGTVHRFT